MAVGQSVTLWLRGVSRDAELVRDDGNLDSTQRRWLVHYDSDESDAEEMADEWVDMQRIKQACRVTSKAKNAGVRFNRNMASGEPLTTSHTRSVVLRPPSPELGSTTPEWTTGPQVKPWPSHYDTFVDGKYQRVDTYPDAAARSMKRSNTLEDEERRDIANRAEQLHCTPQLRGTEHEASRIWRQWQYACAIQGETMSDPADEGERFVIRGPGPANGMVV